VKLDRVEPVKLESARIGRRLRELTRVGHVPADWPYRRRPLNGAPVSLPHVIPGGPYVRPTSTWVTQRRAPSLPEWHIEAPRPQVRQGILATACGQVWGISMTVSVERRGDVESIRRAVRCAACQDIDAAQTGQRPRP
jgi:hypothetical protein